ncbi:MAG TPA: hypothetical protein PLB62_16320, partial [Candidatus Sumerlaeota bacterium]|nr:hypothetical protein [Candidatus Sumerlaeota bacterium]
MRHPLFPGSIFFKKFQALFLLQAYEVLVIITAALIVRRFSRLGDAFTLFAIELALLLDPTFFSNAFFTMVHENVPLWQVTLVNAACLLLVPVKILLLRKTLGIRLTPRMTAAFLFAGATVYLAELPLSTSRGAGWYHQFYYALGWMPLALAALLPSLGKGATVSGGPDYISRRQKSLLDRLLLALPLLIVAAHYLESSQVHGIRFYWLYGAPLLLALGVVIIRHTPDDKASERIVLIDIISILAILVSIGPLNTGGKAAIHGLMEETPEFITRHIPLIVCGLGVILLYVYYFFKFRYKPALARVALLLFCGMTWFLIRIMVTGSLSVSFGRFMRRAIRAFGKGVKWLFGNPVALEALIGVVLWIWVLKKRRTFAAWMPAGCFSLFVLFRHLPLSWENKFPEMFQAMCLYIGVLYHMLLQKKKSD